jgi:endonuclease YncB( thermonuclease family)
VRFYGIDAPELGAPHGADAKRALERLVAGREIELVPVTHDRYDRMVAVVLAGGASVNEMLVAQGDAWAYRAYLGEIRGDERYCELEAEARATGRGLWAQPPSRWVPPWIYRQRQRARPGAAVPSKDYSAETAAACVAAVGD